MLRFHHRLRGFVELVLWDVCCVNGYGSFLLGYVGVGFWRELWLQVWYLVCSYVGGSFLRVWLFWHLLLILRNFFFPAGVGGWFASGVLLCVSPGMEEMTSLNRPVQRLKLAILPPDLPCSGTWTKLIYYIYIVYIRDRGNTVVKVLCYKSEGRWFDPRWCRWNFSLT